MSSICIFNLVKHDLGFEQLNELTNKLMRVALKTNTAVFAHSFDYGENIIKRESMKNFFLLSDSFLYKNCDFLNTSFITDVTDKKESWLQFKKKFYFFNDYLKIIFSYDVKKLEIYMSENINFEEIENIIEVKRCDFLKELFQSIYDKADKYAYGFPTIKFIISR